MLAFHRKLCKNDDTTSERSWADVAGGKNKECVKGYAEYRFKVKKHVKYYLWIRGVGPDRVGGGVVGA